MRELLPVMLLAAACLSSLGAAPQPDAGRPERTVYAWFPRNFGNWDTSAIDWSAITHLCFRSVVLQPDGALREPVPREKVRGLVEEAHAHGVKVTVLVWGTDAAGSSRYLARHRDRAVESLVGYVRDNGLDGLNMDDETWAETNAETNGPNRELVTAFFGALRGGLDDLRPGLHLTWASPPVIDAGDRYGEAWPDYRAIADTIDGFCIMSYCMAPPRTGWTTGAQPVSGGPIVTGHRRDYTTCNADYVAAGPTSCCSASPMTAAVRSGHAGGPMPSPPSSGTRVPCLPKRPAHGPSSTAGASTPSSRSRGIVTPTATSGFRAGTRTTNRSRPSSTWPRPAASGASASGSSTAPPNRPLPLTS
jgi:hypothetical protein